MRDESAVNDDQGRTGDGDPLSPRTARLWDRLLRIPLYHKIVGANVLLLLATLAGALWTASDAVPEFDAGPLLLGGLVVGLGVALNLALLRTALRPLEEIEETARRVEQGDFGARAGPSPVADPDLRRVTDVFNRMLDVVAEYRRRQRALTLRTFEQEEREHAETASKLREQTAQRVATLLVRLRALGDDIGDPEALDQCRELARATLEDLRRTARGLRRPELDDLGLARALRAYATEIVGSDGPRVEFRDASLSGCLSREARLRLYRILQEALANAVEHAEAETVTLRLGADDDTAFAEIRDDGRGFRTGEGAVAGPTSPRPGGEAPQRPDPGGDSDGTRRRGLGLIAMQERARDLDADLSVASQPGRGTSVRVELPCDA